MSNTIKFKRGSGSDPSASDLVVGEVAIRTDNGKLFTKRDNGTVTEITGGGGIDDGDKGDITVSGSGTVFTIDSGVIDNANIASDAAISASKISGVMPTTGGAFTGNVSISDNAIEFDSDSGNTNKVSLQGPSSLSTNVTLTLPNTDGVNGQALKTDGLGNLSFGNVAFTASDQVIGLFDQSGTPVQRLLASTEGVTVQGTSGAVSKLMFRDRTTANFLKFKPVDTFAATVEFTLPSADGSANHVLKTDGSGVMSFGTIATASIADNAVTAAKIQDDLPVNKLSVNSGHIIVGDANGDGSLQALNGDATINNSAVITIANGAINNAKVASDAAIQGSKISPDFGSQNIITTGTFASGNQTITSTAPSIQFTDSDSTPNYQLLVNLGAFAIRDATAGANRLTVNSSGHVSIGGNCTANHLIGGGGSITDLNATQLTTGTIPTGRFGSSNISPSSLSINPSRILGRVSSSAGAGEELTAAQVRTFINVEDGATGDQSANEILTLLKTVDGSGSGLDADTLDGFGSGSYLRSNADDSFSGTITANSDATNPVIKVQGGGPNFIQFASDSSGTVDADSINLIYRTTPNTLAFERASDAQVMFSVDADDQQAIFAGNLDVGAGIDVTGTLILKNAATDSSGLKISQESSDESRIFNHYSGPLTFGTANTERMRIGATGEITTTSHLNMPDSAIIKIGTGDDLQIYHSSDISRIRNTNDSGTLKIQATSNGENAINIVPNGTVELFYDGTKKLETTNLGTKIIGDLFLDNPDNVGKDIQFDSSASKMKFDDGVSANFGSGDDCTLEHSGADFAIINSTGNLNILCNSNQAINLRHGTENMLRAITDGAVELYHDGTRKLHTRSDAVNIIGDLDMTDADNYKINLGASSDLQLYHDGSNSYIKNAVGDLIFQHGSENLMQLKDDGAVQLYFDNVQKLETYSHGIRANQNIDIQGSAYLDDADVSNSTGILHFGDSQDLQIYHDGSDSRIKDSANLKITTNNLVALNYAETQYILRGLNGAQVELYHAGDKRLETTSSGATVTGDLNVSNDVLISSTGEFYGYDNSKLVLGHGRDLQIYHDGSHSYIKDVGTGNLRLDSDTGILFNSNTFTVNNAANSHNMITAFNEGAVELYYNNSKKLETTSSGVTVTGSIAVSGTVDGRDLATDGSKLDGIAAGATNVTNNNQLTNGAGYITASSIPTVTGAAKKFVNFDGTNTTIRNDLGVSSISDHGAGQYTVNFDGNFANTNYTITQGIYRGSGGVLYHFDIDNTITTSSHRIMISRGNNVGNVGLVAADTDQVHMAFHLN